MTYTLSITSKGQITIPKEIREMLGLKTGGKATFYIDNNQVTIKKPKSLYEIRYILKTPSFRDKPTEKEKLVGSELAKKYGLD